MDRLKDPSEQRKDSTEQGSSLKLPNSTEILSRHKLSYSSEQIDGGKNGEETHKKKRERRLKQDNYVRNYVCGCGKSYLSYAALYTHAKTKHKGVFPEGTITLQNRRSIRTQDENRDSTNISGEFKKVYEFNIEFLDFTEQILGERRNGRNKHKKLIEDFPCDIFQKTEDFDILLIKLEQIRRELILSYGPGFLNQIDIIIYEINNAKDLTCNDIFALFLIYSFRSVSIELYKEIVFFVVCYRKYLNEFGWQRSKELAELDIYDPDSEFCENNSAEFVPDMSNEFILSFYSRCVQTTTVIRSFDNLTVLGVEPEKLLTAIILTNLFCRWLYIHKFSKAKLYIIQD